MSPRLRLGSRACQIGGTALGVGSRGPQRCRGKSQNTSTNPCFDFFFGGVILVETIQVLKGVLTLLCFTGN